jgi:alkanesulfonate monooxygenase SsuD/methylene tetrahydromethanopterin reductase-like flavin-dependent oxidoreductase (luciferase family)
VKLGVLLPTFREGAEDALAVALEAERVGLEGVFAFDHLWPMGSPRRPALAPFPVLAAVAARHPSLCVGPLVARVGLVATSKLVDQLTTLAALAPGQVIAALGTGDKFSEAEQVAYGLGHLSADQRRHLLGEAIDALAPLMSVWCGAGSPRTNQLARDRGVVINLWGAAPEAVRELSLSGPVSWAGPLGEDVDAMLGELEGAGATWAVAAAPLQLEAMRAWRRGH